MKVPVFFDSRQTVAKNDSFSPSAKKSGLLAKEWRRLKLPVEFKTFKPTTKRQLYQIHSKDYVDGVLSCKLPNGYGNRSRSIARSLPLVCGSFVSAVEHSMKTGSDSWSLTSGAHHAHFNHGSGFCTFNFLLLGALRARDLGAKKIILCDFDNHTPDGCREIQSRIGLPELEIYAFGEQGITSVAQTEKWLNELQLKLLPLFDGADLIIFNAGVDPFINDNLGGVMSAEQMQRRDRIVFHSAKYFGAATVVSCAGGYSRDEAGTIQPTLDLHTQTLTEYLKVHAEGGSRER